MNGIKIATEKSGLNSIALQKKHTSLKTILIYMIAKLKSFQKLFSIPAYADPKAYKEKYPMVNAIDIKCKENRTLTPKERIFFLEKELHKIRCEIKENNDYAKGRLTKEQCFFLCLYKKEIETIKSMFVY